MKKRQERTSREASMAHERVHIYYTKVAARLAALLLCGSLGGGCSTTALELDGISNDFGKEVREEHEGESSLICGSCADGSCQAEIVSISSPGLPSDGGSTLPNLSANGRYVSFESVATNLVENDTNGVRDVFVRDRQLRTTSRVSLHTSGTQANESSGFAKIAGNGRFVVFTSLASNLVDDDTNGVRDVFVHDVERHETSRVSVGPSGVEGDKESDIPGISADGQTIVFETESALVPNDDNEASDIYVHFLGRRETICLSTDTDGNVGNGKSIEPVISPDGRFVVFYSCASNFVEANDDGLCELFVHDLTNRTTSRIDEISEGGCLGCLALNMSGDGRYLLLINGGGGPMLALIDLVEHTYVGFVDLGEGVVSSDGKLVAYDSRAPGGCLDDEHGNVDIFVKYVGENKLVRLTSPVLSAPGPNAGNHAGADISADGRFIAFISDDDPTLVKGGLNGVSNVFVALVPQ